MSFWYTRQQWIDVVSALQPVVCTDDTRPHMRGRCVMLWAVGSWPTLRASNGNVLVSVIPEPTSSPAQDIDLNRKSNDHFYAHTLNFKNLRTACKNWRKCSTPLKKTGMAVKVQVGTSGQNSISDPGTGVVIKPLDLKPRAADESRPHPTGQELLEREYLDTTGVLGALHCPAYMLETTGKVLTAFFGASKKGRPNMTQVQWTVPRAGTGTTHPLRLDASLPTVGSLTILLGVVNSEQHESWAAPTDKIVEGFEVSERRTVVGPRSWVGKNLRRPGTRPWLRFLKKSNGDGWHVSAYSTKTEAMS